MINQMVIGIWKCDYENEFGTMVNQMVIGFWKCDCKSRKFETKVVLNSCLAIFQFPNLLACLGCAYFHG